MSSKYANVPKQPGIRKNLTTGRYLALKKLMGISIQKYLIPSAKRSIGEMCSTEKMIM